MCSMCAVPLEGEREMGEKSVFFKGSKNKRKTFDIITFN